MPKVITHPDQVTQQWIQSALERGGAIVSGEVRRIDMESAASVHSTIARIWVEYCPCAAGKLPASLFLKICKANGAFVHDSEVNYYFRDYIGLPDAPIPICYDAQHSANEGGAYHILMEDLSETHQKDRVPSLETGIAVARAVAKLHAAGWGERGIRALGGLLPDHAKLNQYLGHVGQGFAPLAEAVGADIDRSSKTAMIDIFQNHPAKMLERANNPIGMAVVHGDLNPGNILFPKIGEGKIYLIDRQPFKWSLTVWLAVSDLSYMMVQYWDTKSRREFEMPILAEYYRQLIHLGIVEYSWEQLIDDYKLTVPQGVYAAAEWCINVQDRNRMRWLWVSELQKSIAAYFDLECD
jgi:uncharacterized protein DUF1679